MFEKILYFKKSKIVSKDVPEFNPILYYWWNVHTKQPIELPINYRSEKYVYTKLQPIEIQTHKKCDIRKLSKNC